jgi:hypothetical protein
MDSEQVVPPLVAAGSEFYSQLIYNSNIDITETNIISENQKTGD